MNTLLSETRERFLLAIVKQVPAAQIAEIHFFQPIKQGGVESGVAVVAAEALSDARSDALSAERSALSDLAEQGQIAEHDIEAEPGVPPEPPALSPQPSALSAQPSALSPQPSARLVIYTARYRLTLKGPDRGKWETNITAEADAPLVTVEAVVRGVQRRSGDVDDPTRMDGDEVRAVIDAKGTPGATA